MYIEPQSFDFIEHFSDKQKETAARYAFTWMRRYTKLLGLDEAYSVALIAVWKAYEAYEEELTPAKLNGYLRGYLARAKNSRLRVLNNEHFCDEMPYGSDCGSGGIDGELDFLLDIQRILDEREYALFDRYVIEEYPIDPADKKAFRNVLEKLRRYYDDAGHGDGQRAGGDLRTAGRECREGDQDGGVGRAEEGGRHGDGERRQAAVRSVSGGRIRERDTDVEKPLGKDRTQAPKKTRYRKRAHVASRVSARQRYKNLAARHRSRNEVRPGFRTEYAARTDGTVPLCPRSDARFPYTQDKREKREDHFVSYIQKTAPPYAQREAR